MSIVDLVAKIEKLPAEKLAELEDLVDSWMRKQSLDEPQEKRPVFGSFKGKIVMSDDFDEPLDEFKEYMYP
ncbi:type II toxin-antitoxin system VapB family antitoxin [Runella sp.]|uniref:type II toxin-antitoxin system VapB family antitoxin n=1 Tax=Runella sp. TaxID=1960881 RepID=UPI003D0DF498